MSQKLLVVHNDDLTTAPFVVNVLQNIFGQGFSQSVKTMIEIHTHGAAIVGTFDEPEAQAKLAAFAALQAEKGSTTMRITAESEDWLPTEEDLNAAREMTPGHQSMLDIAELADSLEGIPGYIGVRMVEVGEALGGKEMLELKISDGDGAEDITIKFVDPTTTE